MICSRSRYARRCFAFEHDHLVRHFGEQAPCRWAHRRRPLDALLPCMHGEFGMHTALATKTLIAIPPHSVSGFQFGGRLSRNEDRPSAFLGTRMRLVKSSVQLRSSSSEPVQRSKPSVVLGEGTADGPVSPRPRWSAPPLPVRSGPQRGPQRSPHGGLPRSYAARLHGQPAEGG